MLATLRSWGSPVIWVSLRGDVLTWNSIESVAAAWLQEWRHQEEWSVGMPTPANDLLDLLILEGDVRAVEFVQAMCRATRSEDDRAFAAEAVLDLLAAEHSVEFTRLLKGAIQAGETELVSVLRNPVVALTTDLGELGVS